MLTEEQIKEIKKKRSDVMYTRHGIGWENWLSDFDALLADREELKAKYETQIAGYAETIDALKAEEFEHKTLLTRVLEALKVTEKTIKIARMFIADSDLTDDEEWCVLFGQLNNPIVGNAIRQLEEAVK